jgi:hypothetical protein
MTSVSSIDQGIEACDFTSCACVEQDVETCGLTFVPEISSLGELSS